MKPALMMVALAATSSSPPPLQGLRLKAGATCYTVSKASKQVNMTWQTITATRDGGKPV